MKDLFTQLFPNADLTKSQRTQLQIVAATVRCCAKLGVAETNLGTVAKSLKVTRTLLQHYFDNMDELLIVSARSVRLNYQKHVVESYEKESARGALRGYLKACFSWPRAKPEEASFWAQFLLLSVTKPKFRALNEEVAALGRERIRALLPGAAPDSRRMNLAAWIQASVTGILIASETDSKAEAARMERVFVESLEALDLFKEKD